ncbi:hypothetical protein MMC17_001738 [Xylographa soralifera]|nr:hypothetical protein [Xylographa soralifera]
MAVLEGTAMPFELQHDNDGSLTFQREQIKTVQLMIEKKRDALQEQNEVRPGITNARDTASGDIDALCDRRNQDGGETRQVRAPPQKPEPARGGIARHTGDFEMPWIPRTDTGPARGTSATRGPRPNSAWEPARTPRQDYGPTVSRQEGVTGRRGSAFEEAAVLAQRAGTPQERRTQDPRQPTRQLPPQDARHYDTQMTSGGGAQGLGINLGTQAGGTASGRVNARDTVGSEGSMFQPPMNAERTQSVGQATRGQWEDNQEEEQEDVQW